MAENLTKSDVRVLINDAEEVLKDKIVFRTSCIERHKNMDDKLNKMEEAVEKVSDCVTKKFNSLTGWAIALLTALVINFGLMAFKAASEIGKTIAR